jgi:hypothetical protein
MRDKKLHFNTNVVPYSVPGLSVGRRIGIVFVHALLHLMVVICKCKKVELEQEKEREKEKKERRQRRGSQANPFAAAVT